MDEIYQKLLNQLDEMMIALQRVEALKVKSPEVMALREEIKKLSKVRSKYRQQLKNNGADFSPSVDLGENFIQACRDDAAERRKFWDTFDWMMANGHTNQQH